MHPTDAFVSSIVAAIVIYDLLAKLAMPFGNTISHRVWMWSVAHPWVPWVYVVIAVVLFVHFFGVPRGQ